MLWFDLANACGSIPHKVVQTTMTKHHVCRQGRYIWHHNQVLKSIAEAISKGISTCSHVRNTTCAITFVKAGEQPRAGQKKGALGILAIAQDWQLDVDLERQLRFTRDHLEARHPPGL